MPRLPVPRIDLRKSYSPYARPPRRTSRFVALWMATLVVVLLMTMWVTTMTPTATAVTAPGSGGGGSTTRGKNAAAAAAAGQVGLDAAGRKPLRAGHVKGADGQGG